jgi:Trypsin-like peptidase domain
VIGCGLCSLSMLSFGPGLRADGPLSGQDRTEAIADEPSLNSTSMLFSAPTPDEPGLLPPRPKPWETAVRMKIHSTSSNVGFGSGTIIYSTPEESIVLTAAHYFRLVRRDISNSGSLTDVRKEELNAANSPFKIEIDLFDGKLTGSKPAQVHFLETVVGGDLMDCDFHRDVALVRIRPGRRLVASRVVPARWKPQAGMRALTVGCSEGRDATAWHTTISKPHVQNFLQGDPSYEAIECETAPKQGRSGGGLFTDDGFLAGVCNYAEPDGDHGLYATPNSIYRLLQRNGIAFIYENAEFDQSKVTDRIAAQEALIQREILKLQVLKMQYPTLSVPLDGQIVPQAEPTRPTPEPPDHESRLRVVEQKLDRILELLKVRESELKSPR